MKQSIAIMAALALGFQANAQSLEEGVKMYKYERYESAKKILTPLAATNPTANYYLGLSELGLENTNEAKTIFSKYAEDGANMSGLARVAFASGNPAEGQRLAQLVADKAKKKEWEPLKYAADALTYSEGANKQTAVDWIEKAYATKGLKKNDSIEVLVSMGDAYRNIPTGGGKSMSSYEKVADIDPKNSLSYSRQGKLWYDAKNYKLALDNYNKAKEADPNNPLPYRDLANAYFWTGKYEMAKQNIEQYLSLSDKSTEDQIQYANILYLSKDYPGAINKVNELVNSGVSKPGFYGILAYSQLETKDTANALSNVRRYFAMQKPEKIFPSDYLNYGKIMLANSMNDSANFYFTKAIAVDTAKDKSETYRQIADGFKNTKTTEGYAKAGEWYGKIVAENPGTKALDYYYYGFYSYYSKNYAAASKAFEQMEAKYPDQPSATYWRARVESAQDEEAKKGTAAPYYEKWLNTNVEGYERKNADLMYAYQYLALYYFNKGDKTSMNTYLSKIEAIEPGNAFLKQMKDMSKKG
ncbi:MAG TPA: hypothetical protein VL098_11685 [Flavipsychrobacter sp.]|nr:hypothetical protein [Flavipsychrobacter sp.]